MRHTATLKCSKMPHPHQQRQLAIIRDFDFSSVRKADAKLVWTWEISRQFLADGYDPAAKLRDVRAFISSPYSKHSTKYLLAWYHQTFESMELPEEQMPDGSVHVGLDLRPSFANLERGEGPIEPNLAFGFEVSPFVKPRELQAHVSLWLKRFVMPRLVHPQTRRGPKSDHLAWLADLAVYYSGNQ